MIFDADTARPVKGGRYNFSATLTTGTVTMQFKPTQDSGQTVAFRAVGGGALTSASTDTELSGDIDLPECEFKAGITGDATFTLDKLPKQ